MGGTPRTRQCSAGCRKARAPRGAGFDWSSSRATPAYGLRQVRRNPLFSGIAIATLALGIGGITAMFSAFDAVLIRPMPYADADRLVMIWDDMAKSDVTTRHNPTPAEWIEWRRLNTVFTDLASSQPGDATLSGDGEPEQVPARKVTWNFWSVLGAQPMLGRVFTEDEDNKGVRVVVISHGLWQRRFGGAPGYRRTQDFAQRRALRGDRRDAAGLLFHAFARHRHLDAGFVSLAGCGRTSHGTTRRSSRGSSPA